MSGGESTSNPVIRVEHVTRTLAGEVPVTLVEEVNLEIERGEFVCVMGPSGSGKSSLLYLLGLLDVPTRGRIWIDGEDTTGFDDDRLTDFRLARLGYEFQFLLAEFSVVDNVSLPIRKLGRLADGAARERAAQLLDRLGLEGQHDKR